MTYASTDRDEKNHQQAKRYTRACLLNTALMFLLEKNKWRACIMDNHTATTVYATSNYQKSMDAW